MSEASAGVCSKLKTARAVGCRKNYPDHELGWVGTISRSRREERTSLVERYQSVGFVRRGSAAFFKKRRLDFDALSWISVNAQRPSSIRIGDADPTLP